MADSALKRAVDSYRADARFRAVAQSIVARVMQDHGPIDPERADRDAYDIALQATVLLLQRVYEEDPELAAMRAERDHYKKIAEDVPFMTPRSFVIAKPGETRNTLDRLSADESLSLEFRLACRKELGDTVEFAGVASFVKPDAAG